MTLAELIARASAGYEKEFPDVPLTDQCGADGIPFTPAEYAANPTGDSLGRFVVQELFETFDPAAADADQLAAAVDAIQDAIDDLHNVVTALGG